MDWFNIFIGVLPWVLTRLFAPRRRAPGIKPATLADIDAPTAEEGRPIPVLFGMALVRGANVVWYGDLKAEPIKKDGGKK